MNYELLASDVKDYIKVNDLKDVCIMGHSLGGKTTMALL